jgi:hypothetical protein
VAFTLRISTLSALIRWRTAPSSLLEFLNATNGGEWASLPVVVFYTNDFHELHRYIEYPAIYHNSPFFDLWASAGIDEILSALYEKVTVRS